MQSKMQSKISNRVKPWDKEKVGDYLISKGITKEKEARIYFEQIIEDKSIIGLLKWWEIYRSTDINWVKLLKIDPSKYYTFNEAKKRVKELEIDYFKSETAHKDKDAYSIYNNVFMVQDNKLPADPRCMYNLQSFTDLYKVDYDNFQ